MTDRMLPTWIRLPEESIAAEWLTEVLRSSGNLINGAVVSVTSAMFETPPSVLTRLTVKYSRNASVDASRHLILKVPKPHKVQRFLREVRFYRRVAPLLAGVGLVRCVAFCEGDAFHPPWLLLEDVTVTHRSADGEDLAASDLAEIASGLAGLHATMWNHAQLEEAVGISAEASFWNDCEGNERRYGELVGIFGDRLPDHWKRIYRGALDDVPALLLTRIQQGALTLCHPDSHSGNFLLPRKRKSNSVLIVDWHDYLIGWGVGDVARLLMGDTELRRQHEQQALRHYHAALCAAGVSGYDWSELWEDYRLSVLRNIFVPLGNRKQP